MMQRTSGLAASWLEEEEEEPTTLTFTQLLSSTPSTSNSLFPSQHQRQYSSLYQPSPTIAQEVEQSGKAPDMKMDNILKDSVPCRVRAKRGCATHPRSVAERLRRTRISDRIRKLQELVPNLDKQTNTAAMLDEAVAYVKFLQKQIEELSEHQRKCKCEVQE